MVHSILAALLAVTTVSVSYATDPNIHPSFNFSKGMLCKDHPVYGYTAGLRPEIIRSWNYAEKRTGRMLFEPSFYVPRYPQHIWAPIDNKSSKKYANLDLFVTFSHRGDAPREEHVQLSFQREAKVYLMLFARAKEMKPVDLPGWQPEGWAVLVKGTVCDQTVLGVYRKMTRHVPKLLYVWSRTGTDVVIPNIAWVRNNFRGDRVSSHGVFNVMVAERDGNPVPTPAPPSNIKEKIPAGGRCPTQLHNEWKVIGHDEDDDETKNEPWLTYHPLWDPCYWCAYDHEHGSDPKSLMGYEPKYHYTAFKNSKQNESHRGFKGFVFREGAYFVYYGIHAHLSGPSRFEARTHTVVVAVTRVSDREPLAELSFKADFGVAAGRYANGKPCPLKRVDQILFDKHGLSKGLRQVNILDPKNIDKRFLLNKRMPTVGRNEHWFSKPLCSMSRVPRGVQVDFKDPGTAIRTQKSPIDDFVPLGRTINGVFVQRGSHRRDIRFENFRLKQDLCIYKLGDIQGGLRGNGKFYTDPFGKKLLPKAGERAIAQVLKKELDLQLDGKYMPSDTWVGLHVKGYRGTMQDVGHAIDPSLN